MPLVPLNASPDTSRALSCALSSKFAPHSLTHTHTHTHTHTCAHFLYTLALTSSHSPSLCAELTESVVGYFGWLSLRSDDSVDITHLIGPVSVGYSDEYVTRARISSLTYAMDAYAIYLSMKDSALILPSKYSLLTYTHTYTCARTLCLCLESFSPHTQLTLQLSSLSLSLSLSLFRLCVLCSD